MTEPSAKSIRKNIFRALVVGGPVGALSFRPFDWLDRGTFAPSFEFYLGEAALVWWFFAFGLVPLAIVHTALIVLVQKHLTSLLQVPVSVAISLILGFMTFAAFFIPFAGLYFTLRNPFLVPFLTSAAAYGFVAKYPLKVSSAEGEPDASPRSDAPPGR